MSAGGANGVAVVGGHSEKRIIETSLDGFLFLIVDLVLVDFCDADSTYFLRVEESELNFCDLEPLPHGLYIVLHDC